MRKRFVILAMTVLITALGPILAVSPGMAATSAALTPEQSQAVEKLIHDYLLQNPRVLKDAIQHAKETADADAAAEAKRQIATHKQDLERDATTPVLGNPDGDVTLVEFFDFRCPYCRASADAVQQLITANPKIRVVAKEYPVLGPDSVFASRAALVAMKHGKYREFYKAVFALPQKVTPESAIEVLKSLGLDPVAARKEMDEADITATINRNLTLGRTLGVDGTPTFIAGTDVAPGELDLAALQQFVTSARGSRS